MQQAGSRCCFKDQRLKNNWLHQATRACIADRLPKSSQGEPCSPESHPPHRLHKHLQGQYTGPFHPLTVCETACMSAVSLCLGTLTYPLTVTNLPLQVRGSWENDGERDRRG